MNLGIKFFLISVFCVFAFILDVNAALNLTGSFALEKTADTALLAKNAAFNQARREIIHTVLSRYSDASAVSAVLENTPDADLIPLVAMSSVENEKASNTTYNAAFTMTLDKVMVTKWMQENNIPNYLAAADTTGDRATVFFYVGGGLRQWATLMMNLREQGLDKEIELKTMQGRNVSVTIPMYEKSKYLNALRGLGWKVSETDGILRVIQ